MCPDDSIFHGFVVKALDRAGFRSSLSDLFRGFPDMRFRLDDLFSEDNKVALRYYREGTHQSDYEGMAASGKPISV